jgi:hypothetical protein
MAHIRDRMSERWWPSAAIRAQIAVQRGGESEKVLRCKESYKYSVIGELTLLWLEEIRWRSGEEAGVA